MAVSESGNVSVSVSGGCLVGMLLVSRLWLRNGGLGLGRGRGGLGGVRCRLRG